MTLSPLISGAGLEKAPDRAPLAPATRSYRVAIVATHPIQHFVPFYRALSLQPDLTPHVFFGSRIGLEEYFDPEMNARFSWHMDLTSGYQHDFLRGADRIRSTAFASMNNPAVWKSVSRFRPDVVVVYGYANLTAVRTIAGALLRKIPVLLVSDSEPLQSRSAARIWVKRLLLPRLVGAVSGFLTVGDCNERYWTGFGAPHAKLFRTPFTIDEPTYLLARANRAELRRDWRRERGIEEREVVFLAVGKLSARKRQRDILTALALARHAAPAARVVLAGDGAERGALEDMAREADLPVTFLGFVNLDELPQVYAAADVLVHASARDPHPLVFSEAACLGLPIVASDRVGAIGSTDIAQPGVNALVFPQGDVRRLAAALTDLTCDPLRREAMGEASLRVFRSQDMATSVAGLRSAVRAVVG